MSGNMRSVYYHAPKNFEIKEVPTPQIGDDEVLFKVACCGICGTDEHVHDGEFITKFPLIPGHEVVGTVADMGRNVKDFAKGDRVVADPGVTCGTCFYCRKGKSLLCENFNGRGVTSSGGFAEFVAFDAKKVYKIHNLTDEEATLIEPAACAIHGVDQLNISVGVTIAANRGIKTDIAKQLDAGDEYIELDRVNPEFQWRQLKKDNPYGFDVVVEATGSEKIASDAINYVRKGGTLMIYGVYDNAARVHWPPSKIFVDEIRIIGSFAQTHCFPRAVAYLDSGKVKVKGLVTDVFRINEYQQALDKMRSRKAVKIVIKP